MRYGCCLPGGPCDAARAQRLLRMGFDYAEIAAAPLGAMREEEFATLCREVRAGGLPVETANCFLPGELSLFAPQQAQALRGHVTRVLHRAAELGIRVIVFGSGGARRIPEGVSREAGEEALCAFLAWCGALCRETDVTLAVEPLRRAETNLLNTVEETARLLRPLGLSRVRLLADAYHVFCEEEPLSHLAGAAELLAHVHVAEPPRRVTPGADGGEYLARFTAALRGAGYGGRISIECGWTDFEAEMEQGLAFLRAQEAAHAPLSP